MKELVIVSGKGGTGKTSISAALAFLAPYKVIVDCDVDAANFHLVSGAAVRKSEGFKAGFEPEVDGELCNACGKCTELCRFEAMTAGVITAPLLCEGCGVCAVHCPEHAIAMKEREAGRWFVSESRFGPLVHAELGLAIENSGKLVSKVRQEGKRLAEAGRMPLVLIDGPPGIGCPAIAALSGVSMALAVVEPSLSAMHDLERLAELVQYFQLPLAVCINKSTLHPENTRNLKEWCRQNNIPVYGEIPYSDTFRQAVQSGQCVLELPDKELAAALSQLWNALAEQLRVPATESRWGRLWRKMDLFAKQ